MEEIDTLNDNCFRQNCLVAWLQSLSNVCAQEAALWMWSSGIFRQPNYECYLVSKWHSSCRLKQKILEASVWECTVKDACKCFTSADLCLCLVSLINSIYLCSTLWNPHPLLHGDDKPFLSVHIESSLGLSSVSCFASTVFPTLTLLCYFSHTSGSGACRG